jgi:hypothetical protein
VRYRSAKQWGSHCFIEIVGRSAGGGRIGLQVSSKMKALVKSKAETGLWLADVPEPTMSINDVLIRVDRTGICGTDLHI